MCLEIVFKGGIKMSDSDVEKFYREKILESLTGICVHAYKDGFADGLKLAKELKNKNEEAEPDNTNYDGVRKKIGGNTSEFEYSSQLNNNLGILGE